MINVLIVEDSPVMQKLIEHTLTSDKDIRVIGFANDGEAALEATLKLKPDIITMDWYMPKLNGFEATRRIMENAPTPIVIITGSVAISEVFFSFVLIEAGTLAVVKKPPSIDHPDYAKDAQELINTVKLMSEVKVVTRKSVQVKEPKIKIPDGVKENEFSKEIKLVAVGASTGGPLVLQKILSGISKDFSIPVLIVQHIAHGFNEGFVEWLIKTTNFPLHIAAQYEYPLPGHGYIASEGYHLGINSSFRIVLNDGEPEHGMRPSVSYLFRSVAQSFGANAVGILLTGMGSDGSHELKLMKDTGAVTIAQNQETSVVHGMPGEAIKEGAATFILSPDEIISFLNKLNKNMRVSNGYS